METLQSFTFLLILWIVVSLAHGLPPSIKPKSLTEGKDTSLIKLAISSLKKFSWIDQQYWREYGQNDLKARLSMKLNTNQAKNVILFVGDGMVSNSCSNSSSLKVFSSPIFLGSPNSHCLQNLQRPKARKKWRRGDSHLGKVPIYGPIQGIQHWFSSTRQCWNGHRPLLRSEDQDGCPRHW